MPLTDILCTAKHEHLESRFPSSVIHRGFICAILTILALFVHGYHPYAEDGGIYLAGIKYLLHLELFPYARGFVTAHLRFSLFAPAVALLARTTFVHLPSLVFSLYLASTYLTLFSAWEMIRLLLHDESAQQWGVVLLAASLTVPVAGTSLVVMDPYLTARSFAMPCVLVAMAAALRLSFPAHGAVRSRLNVVILLVALLAAITIHPLSGGYGLAVVSLLGAFALPRLRLRILVLALLVLTAVALCLILQWFSAPVPFGYSIIAQTRSYWFLASWRWYEYVGLGGPLAILVFFSTQSSLSKTARLLASAAAGAGLLSIAITILFVHRNGPSFAVARLQPLRIFQLIYVLLPLFLGASLAQFTRMPLIRASACAAAALMLFATQRLVYPNSAHLELPWREPRNGWEQAFVWIRSNTPANAIVALDADYITDPTEDAQNFRAISERSTPADNSKDGGIAAIRPELTRAWFAGVQLQQGLATATDAKRLAKLVPEGIQWIVLPQAAQTGLPCPYRNRVVAVCRLTAVTDSTS